MFNSTQQTSSSLTDLTNSIDRILDGSGQPDIRAIKNAIRHAFSTGNWIPDEMRKPNIESYARHVLHSDQRRRYTLLALVWNEGQMSPVHAHHTWCAYSVVSGELFEEQFAYDLDSHAAVARGGAPKEKGEGAYGPAGLNQIHRIRNARRETAMSVHVYGVPATELSSGVNNVLRMVEPATV